MCRANKEQTVVWALVSAPCQSNTKHGAVLLCNHKMSPCVSQLYVRFGTSKERLSTVEFYSMLSCAVHSAAAGILQSKGLHKAHLLVTLVPALC